MSVSLEGRKREVVEEGKRYNEGRKLPVAPRQRPPALRLYRRLSVVRIVPVRPYDKGRFAFVDDEDYDKVCGFSWYPSAFGHAISRRQENCQVKNYSMHRRILDVDSDDVVDHIDGNVLNNTRANLRITDHQGNATNQRKQRTRGGKPTTSKYKGVSWHKKNKRWESFVSVNGKQIRLGSFPDEEEAARAYDTAAREHYGKYGRFNFPQEGELGIFGG